MQSAENVRRYTAPESNPGNKAALMLVSGGKAEGGFREEFERATQSCHWHTYGGLTRKVTAPFERLTHHSEQIHYVASMRGLLK